MPGRTGPITPEGKKKSSMNGLKHGKYMSAKSFMNLGAMAGKLMFCIPCGKEQQETCNIAQACAMQDHMILAYSKAAFENDLKALTEVNVVQLANMDMVFSYKLRYAMQNLGETKKIRDANGKMVTVPVITEQHIYELMNMMRTLGKTPMDMQITRSTQEAIDVEWAKLLEAEIDRERAQESKEQILQMMQNWRQARQEAQHLEAEDKDIKEFMNKNQNEDTKALPEARTMGPNPFAQINEKEK